jgi:hypothetical protein
MFQMPLDQFNETKSLLRVLCTFKHFNYRQIMLGRVSKAVLSLAATLALICALFPSSSDALYFYLEGSEQKCFIEELPKDTTVLGN